MVINKIFITLHDVLSLIGTAERKLKVINIDI
jgi:hypothetical protein